MFFPCIFFLISDQTNFFFITKFQKNLDTRRPIKFLYMQTLKMLLNYKPFSTQEFFNIRGRFILFFKRNNFSYIVNGS